MRSDHGFPATHAVWSLPTDPHLQKDDYSCAHMIGVVRNSRRLFTHETDKINNNNKDVSPGSP